MFVVLWSGAEGDRISRVIVGTRAKAEPLTAHKVVNDWIDGTVGVTEPMRE